MLDSFPKLLSLSSQFRTRQLICLCVCSETCSLKVKGQFFARNSHLKVTYVTLIHLIIFHKLSLSHILKQNINC